MFLSQMKPAAGQKPTAIAPTVMSASVSFYAALSVEKALVDPSLFEWSTDVDQSTMKE
ncbi:hypothetical protein ALQ08_103035 [Pseudomonas syringae pv. delphinii]|uniref:Uncharacterized protein n=3 Tax=Pseudomonas syringae group genomosp. 3 TaxID=251701 RepID=Q87WA5_PSESM|nr:hypothetical protein [Pseudomonas syringae group genomosp. 3]AAO58095.1 hypothetical protein PSPTO_4649 [Pseudomonas syringae pv. tomato str. DC3000]KPY85534.1 Uncharacterized protein ALO36_04824 [Pseudomonas syringae pv. tomato]MBW8024479.1 hypothetical protein [Pseudomonas syringae pv. tomato]RMP13481.1 hypothetical protein ALQ28_04680 [Pseudomonas syringae pv. delphinii]RMP23718.1 hypothetical protein ALQ27_103107 [Pseudomonas syringae pv. delphinii]